MKILVYEYLSARYDSEDCRRSASGFRGDILLQSLLSDICRLRRVDVTVLRDPSLPAVRFPNSAHVLPSRRENAETTVAECMLHADAIWPVVPESAGMLEAASRQILAQNKLLIGSCPDSITVTASKYLTSKALEKAGVATVGTYRMGEPLPEGVSAWVVKPDDGAGCTNTHLFADRHAALAWIGERGGEQYVLQPFVHGRHRSMSLVCAESKVLLLSINEQRIVVSDNQLHYMGSTVNGLDDPFRKFRELADSVLAAIPGLWGYVGIDFIMSGDGPIVLEVNPRITTAHTGLHESIGYNPAQLILDVLQKGQCKSIEPKRVKPISVDVNAFQDLRNHRTA